MDLTHPDQTPPTPDNFWNDYPTAAPSFIIPPTSAKTPQVENDSYQIGYNIYIQPTYITVLPEWHRPDRTISRKEIENRENLKNNKHQGTLSQKAQKRVRNSVNWLVQSATTKRVHDKTTGKNYNFKVNFITLTLPTTDHNISDHHFKKVMLHRFINNCRYKYGLKNYLWKVEAQKNGNIHCHMTTDTFIHHHGIRRTWNKICESEGLIEPFEKKHGHREPPSTEIKSVRKVKKIGAYISKEMAKNDKDRRVIKGKLWASSYSISSKNQCKADPWMDEAPFYLEPLTTSKIPMSLIEREVNRMGTKETIGEIYYMTPADWKTLKGTPLGELYNDHRFKIRHNLQDFPPEYFDSFEHSLTILN